MELEDLYKLIRKEPVCLFIGSGFSLYTGMPSANRLKEFLCQSLTPGQQQKIDITKDLRKFTEDYQVLFGRPKLIRVLQQHFDYLPVDTHLHDLLAKIAYFKSIITTNYDRLIENSMGDRVAVIVNNAQVFGSKRAKCRVYKIHGDIRDGKSIVITSSDYAQQYNRLFKDPFWSAVIAEISTQHIVFIGYSYEDENVWADFDYIEEKLQNKNKKRILISPGANTIKKRKLKQLNIDYIQSDGETFINGLIEALKANIVEDHRQSIVDTQTAQDFITAFDMKVDIRATRNSTEVIDISKVSGTTAHTIQFSTSNLELMKSYREFSSGYTIRDLQIKAEQLDSFSFLIEDFTFMDKTSLAYLNVSHQPKYDGVCKIKFPEKQFTLHKVKCRLFNTVLGKILIEIEVSGFEMEFRLEFADDKPQLHFKVIEPESPAPVNKSYEVFRALYLLFSGEKIEIVNKSGRSFQQRLTAQNHARMFEFQTMFFHSLKKIEKSFQVNFSPIYIGKVTDDEKEVVQKLVNLINHGYYAVKQPDGVTIEHMPESKEVFDALRAKITSESYVSLVTKTNRDIVLFNKVLNLGREQVSLKQPTAVELDFEMLRAKLIAIDEVLVYHYQKFGLWEFQGSQTLWAGA